MRKFLDTSEGRSSPDPRMNGMHPFLPLLAPYAPPTRASSTGGFKNRFPGRTKFVPALLASILIVAFSAALRAETSDQQFKRADDELNRVYRELRAALTDEQKEELKQSEKLWISERDSLAAAAASQNQRFAILTRSTIERTEALRKTLASLRARSGNSSSSTSDFERADQELNRVYRQLRDLSPQLDEERLKEDEKRWIEAKKEAASRVANAQERKGLLLRLTVERTRELSERLLAMQTNGRSAPSDVQSNPIPSFEPLTSGGTASLDVNSPLRVEFSDDAGGFATISASQSLLATGNGNKVTLWDLKTGYLLAKKEFPFEVCGLEFDTDRRILWIVWYDDPRYGRLRMSRLDPVNGQISNIIARLDLRPRDAECIVAPKEGFVVTSKTDIFLKESNDCTYLSLYQPQVPGGNDLSPALAVFELKGHWSLGAFADGTAFTLADQKGTQQVFLVEDIQKSNDPEVHGSIQNLKSFDEIAANRDEGMAERCAAVAKWLEDGRGKFGITNPSRVHFRAREKNVCLWRIETSNGGRNLITREGHSDQVALKDRAPSAWTSQPRYLRENCILYDDRLKWTDNTLLFFTEAVDWTEEHGTQGSTPKVVASTAVDLSSLGILDSATMEGFASNKPQSLRVDKDGSVRSEDGKVILKLRHYSGSEDDFPPARAWEIPGTSCLLVARKDGATVIDCVDRNGSVLSSTTCGWDFMGICYFPEIAFAPARNAFALFGYGMKNHAAAPAYFELNGLERPKIKAANSDRSQNLISQWLTLDFYPYVIHIKPGYLAVSRFGTDTISSEWGFDSNPGYAADAAFATNILRRQIAVLGSDGRRADLLHVGMDGALEHLATLKVDNRSVTAITPDNYYVHRGDLAQGIHFVKGRQAYPFEQFDLRLNRPDIVLDRIGAPAEAVAIAKELRGKRLKRMGVTEEMLKPDFHLPDIEIIGEVPATTEADEIKFSIKAKDSKYPLERLKLYQNNVPVNGRDGELLRDHNTRMLERTVPIQLAAGRNKIQLSVLNHMGAESLYANAEVNCTAKRPKPALYAIAIGVSKYSNPEWNLDYAAKDAQDILAQLKVQASSQYGEIRELLLTDTDVTKESLNQVKDFLTPTTIDDTVLIFVAGHGLLDSKYDYYFGTTDVDFKKPSERGITFDEFDDILADLPSLKKCLLIDTCHAGELDEDEKKTLASVQSPPGQSIVVREVGPRAIGPGAFAGSRAKSAWYDRLQGLFVDLRRGSGATILSSAAGAEAAYETSDQKNGLFTHAVLQALGGDPDADGNQDGELKISELANYVQARVAALSEGFQHPNVRQVNLEGDFVIVQGISHTGSAPSEKKSEHTMPEHDHNRTTLEQQPVNTAKDLQLKALNAFVEEYMASLRSNDPSATSALYAKQSYYKYWAEEGHSGPASRSFIEKGHREYITKFPQRSYELVGTPSQMLNADLNSGSVRFTYRYSVSGKKTASGQSEVRLDLQWAGSKWEITRFDETVRRD